MVRSPTLQMSGITKSYPGVKALSGVTFDVRPGEVHALMGENGAGKSTLMKILAGAERADSGGISLGGQDVQITSPQRAIDLGIAIIYQEFNLVPHLTVAENIFLGHEPKGAIPGTLSGSEMRLQAKVLLESIGARINVESIVQSLSIAQQQMVEIAKAISKNARVIAMDEPSATLTTREIEALFTLIERLRESGVAIIYVSHRMGEIFRIADRLTVLRDGQVIGTVAAKNTTPDELIKMMVGRTLDDNFPRATAHIGEALMEVTGLTRRGVIEDISLTVRSGEIVALAGLVGSGRTELARCLFGADRYDSGTLSVAGKPFCPRSPRDAIRVGIGLVPEDRKCQGLLLTKSIRMNETLAALGHYALFGFIRGRAERKAAVEYSKSLGVKTPSVEQNAGSLSGGNQQKVVLAKWLATRSCVLIMDEPTRGIDVGAKVEIYRLMNKLVGEGNAILMISSELPEVIGMASRVYVMRNGRIAGELARDEATQESIGRLALGG